MRFASCSAWIATTHLAIHARALPHPHPAPTYSVVDVGGPSTSTEEPATVYETVNYTTPGKTITEVAPAATVTATPEGPIIPHVATSVIIHSVTTTKAAWTVAISVVTSSSTSTSCTSSSTTSATSTSTSTSTPCTSTSSTLTTYPTSSSSSSTWPQPTYTPPVAPYYPPVAASYPVWNSTTSQTLYPTGTGHARLPTLSSSTVPCKTGGHAAPTGWSAQWNATEHYTRK